MSKLQESDKIITFDELYREYTLKALNRAGSVKGAALLLGTSERTVYRWKKVYGICLDPRNGKYFIRKTTLHEKGISHQPKESPALA